MIELTAAAVRHPDDLQGLLTARELEVIALASSGLTNIQIGLRLHLTVHAVKFHLAAIYRKLGVANRTEAAFVYLNGSAARPGEATG